MRIGDGDEGIGDWRQDTIEAADAVGPTGAVERGEDDGHADAAGRQSAPEHFVAGSDGDDGVDVSFAKQVREPRPDAEVVFVGEQVVVDRDFAGEQFAQFAAFFQAAELR